MKDEDLAIILDAAKKIPSIRYL